MRRARLVYILIVGMLLALWVGAMGVLRVADGVYGSRTWGEFAVAVGAAALSGVVLYLLRREKR